MMLPRINQSRHYILPLSTWLGPRLSSNPLQSCDECPSRYPAWAHSFQAVSAFSTAPNRPTTTTTTTNQKQQDRWNRKLQDFNDFVRQHGHARVPQSHDSLGRWVNANRKQYKKYIAGTNPCWMTTERIELLQEAGFVWDADEATWMDFYDQMCNYHKEHGDW